MATKALTTKGFSPFEDLLKPWNEWFDQGNIWGKTTTVPAVNIAENEMGYTISMAAPGLKKDDFNIRLEGDMITISAENEEQVEEKKDNYTRKEYNFNSFSRSFTLPEDVKKENINAVYTDGVLKLMLPRMEVMKKPAAMQQIAVH